MRRRPGPPPLALASDRQRRLLEVSATPLAAVAETSLFALYDGYPDRATPFVVREWVCVPGGRPRPLPLKLARTLAAARGLVPQGYRRRPRQKADDRRILEVWVPLRGAGE
jgi:hypothetical protein